MINTNMIVIYSLKLHIALQKEGFIYLTEMKNPKDAKYNCWVYEDTPAFRLAFERLKEEAAANGK